MTGFVSFFGKFIYFRSEDD